MLKEKSLKIIESKDFHSLNIDMNKEDFELKRECIYSQQRYDFISKSYFSENKTSNYNATVFNFLVNHYKKNHELKKYRENLIKYISNEIKRLEKREQILYIRCISKEYNKKIYRKALEDSYNLIKENEIYKRFKLFSKNKKNIELNKYIFKEIFNDMYFMIKREDFFEKYFNYISKKFELDIKYDKKYLNSDFFVITIEKKDFTVSIKKNDKNGSASGLYSDDRNCITLYVGDNTSSYMSINNMFVFSHEFGHLIENNFIKKTFKNKALEVEKLSYNNYESISIFFENIICENEFICLLNNDKLVKNDKLIQFMEFNKLYCYLFESIFVNMIFDMENFDTISYFSDEVFDCYLEIDLLDRILFVQKYSDLAFDEYLHGSINAFKIEDCLNS